MQTYSLYVSELAKMLHKKGITHNALIYYQLPLAGCWHCQPTFEYSLIFQTQPGIPYVGVDLPG